MLIITQTALELGFLYALVAMALFLSYRILDIADLTTDGCFVLGAAVSVTVTAAGHPVLAIFVAMLAGACAGFVTAFLQTKLGVPSILAGIVTNTGLYTVNLMAMGWKSNQSLLGGKTIFTMLRETGIGGEWYELLLAAFVTLLAGLLLVLFLGTRMGLSIRATGDNPDMVRASSLNPSFTITVGLCLANMLTALSGGQRQALTLLMATMVPPQLLLLDEHTAALDPATAEKVLELTRRVVAESHITCLMVTHNMHQALELGNRTLMMADGHIVLDVAGSERAGMGVDDLIARFKAGAGHELDNDRILLSE